MYIRQVTIENIRRFGSEKSRLQLTLPPSGWIVVAGPNGSGKTTFLRVLALAMSARFSYDYADTLNAWIRQGARQARSRVTLVPGAQDKFRLKNEAKVSKDEQQALEVGDDWEAESRLILHGRETDSQRASDGPWHQEPEGWFAAGYGAYRNLSAQSNTPEAWSDQTTRESAFLTLFRSEASLAAPIRWLMALDYRNNDENVDAAEQQDAKTLVDDVISILNTGLLDAVKILRVDSKGLLVKEDGLELYINRLGSGTQALVALVVDMLRHIHARFGRLAIARDESGSPIVNNSGVVLIDEVEQHLHPAWQRRVGFWFKKHFPNIQFIVTTHSPFVCQAATEKGLVILPGKSSGHAKIGSDKLYQKVINGSVDDALLSVLFGLDRTWSDEAEERRSRFALLETKVLTGAAKAGERTAYKRLRKKVPQTMSDEVDRIAKRVLGGLDEKQ